MRRPPPTEDELVGLAERALAHLDGEAQATAWWERTVHASGGAHLERSVVSVEVLVLLDGRPGVVVTTEVDDDGLRAAARRARKAAEREDEPGPTASGGLPEPATGRAHAGYDPALVELDPTTLVAEGRRWRAGAAKTAIVSTRGISSYEQRSFAALAVDAGRGTQLSAASLSPAGVDGEGLAAEAASLTIAEGETVAAPTEALPVVLGPDAVAAILDLLREELTEDGALAVDAVRGTRVVASSVNLSDSPRFASTLPRSYDALGVPRQPVPLIQDGVAHRVVSLETGHAVVAGRPTARPDHLVLVGGGAADVHELMAPLDHGIYLPTLEGGFEIVDGRRGRPLAPVRVLADARRVLAATQALSSRQRTIATAAGSARTVGASVCPALRTTGGIALAA